MLIAYFVRSNGFILSEMHGSEANFSNLTKNTKKLSLFFRIQDSSKSVVRLGNSSNTKKLMMECSAGVWTLHRTLQPGVARPLGKDPRQFWLTRVQDTRCWGFRKGSTNTFHIITDSGLGLFLGSFPSIRSHPRSLVLIFLFILPMPLWVDELRRRRFDHEAASIPRWSYHTLRSLRHIWIR